MEDGSSALSCGPAIASDHECKFDDEPTAANPGSDRASCAGDIRRYDGIGVAGGTAAAGISEKCAGRPRLLLPLPSSELPPSRIGGVNRRGVAGAE